MIRLVVPTTEEIAGSSGWLDSLLEFLVWTLGYEAIGRRNETDLTEYHLVRGDRVHDVYVCWLSASVGRSPLGQLVHVFAPGSDEVGRHGSLSLFMDDRSIARLDELHVSVGFPGAGVFGTDVAVAHRSDEDGIVRVAKVLDRVGAFGSYPAPRALSGTPVLSMIEPTRSCQLRCPGCPTGSRETYLAAPLSVERMKLLVEDIGEYAWLLSLFNYGEPTLHPDLVSLVAIANGAAIPVIDFHTNGMLLGGDLYSRLAAAGLTRVRFAVDGLTQETYSRYRVGGELDTVLRNILECVSARDTRQLSTEIEAQVTVSRINEPEVPELTSRLMGMGVDRVVVKTFNTGMRGAKAITLLEGYRTVSDKFHRHAVYQMPHAERLREVRGCPWPRTRLVINADGEMPPCCYDFNATHSLGSAFAGRRPFWESPNRSAFVYRLTHEPDALDMCAACPMGNTDCYTIERHTKRSIEWAQIWTRTPEA